MTVRPARRLSRGNRPAIHRYYDIPAESPDGTRILYFEFDAPPPGPGRLIVAAADGGNPREIAHVQSGCTGHIGAVACWVDDNTIHYSPRGEDGTNGRLLSLNDGSHVQINGRIRAVHEGRGLANLSMADVTDAADEFSRRRQPVWEALDIRTGDRRVLVTAEAAHAAHPLRDRLDVARCGLKNAKWSPDGTMMSVVFSDIFHAKFFGTTRQIISLMVVDVDSGHVRYLGEFTHHPLWAPDGSFLFAHVRREDGDGLDLVAFPVDGSDPYPMAERFRGNHTSLDRSMEYALTDCFDYAEEGTVAVVRYKLATGAGENLYQAPHPDRTHGTGFHCHPQYSRDESRILFNAEAEGQPQVFEIGAE